MNGVKRLPLRLIQQNVYALDLTPAYSDGRDFHIDSYVAQDRVTEDRALKDKTTIQPYPITQESVNSYSDISNYRLDVRRATSRPAPGPNFSDQDTLKMLLSLSPDEFRQVVSDLSAKANVSRETVQGEVTDNG